MNKIELILTTLEKMYPNAKVELFYRNNFELLVAVILSAQTTDIAVNKVTPILFKKYPTPKLLKEAVLKDVENIIKTIGLYRTKARNIIKTAELIETHHNGEIPNNRKELEALPGVGRKTANVVLANAFNQAVIAVDTHVARVSKRLGLAKEDDDTLAVENKLVQLFPQDKLQKLHHQLIFFGRYHCQARKPKCYQCPLIAVCQYENKNLLK